MFKTCSKCLSVKDINLFPWKSKSLGKKSSYCKDCQKALSKDHYIRNKALYSNKAKINNKSYKTRNYQYVLEHLLHNPCVDCGETDVEVLQFDHIEMIGSSGKRIGHYMAGSIEALQKEINKCQVRCGNCHIRRTRSQMGWFRISPDGGN